MGDKVETHIKLDFTSKEEKMTKAAITPIKKVYGVSGNYTQKGDFGQKQRSVHRLVWACSKLETTIKSVDMEPLT